MKISICKAYFFVLFCILVHFSRSLKCKNKQTSIHLGPDFQVELRASFFSFPERSAPTAGPNFKASSAKPGPGFHRNMEKQRLPLRQICTDSSFNSSSHPGMIKWHSPTAVITSAIDNNSYDPTTDAWTAGRNVGHGERLLKSPVKTWVFAYVLAWQDTALSRCYLVFE